MPYKDPEKQKEVQRRSYLRNKKKIQQRHLERADEIKKYKEKYRQENKDYINKWKREYMQTHPEARAQRNAYNSNWCRVRKDLKDAYRKAHPEYDQRYNEARRERRRLAKERKVT